MALQKTLTINGINIENAYIRVDTISGYKGGITISVNSYTTQDAFNTGAGYLKQQIYTFTPSVVNSASNFIKQSYEYLKSLEEFKEATDILEAGQIS